MNKEPIRHHYIPQFILRNFCDEKGYVNFFDKATKEISRCKPRDIFMSRNLYRDEINYVENPTQIETDLAKYEQEISLLIKKKMFEKDRVVLTKEEEEKLKLFFAIMGFRSLGAMQKFAKGLSKEGREMYSVYQKDGNFQDMWKRNLGYLVNCRSVEEVLKHEKIDDVIKVFMMRDAFGVLGLYLVVAEKRDGAGFIIGDRYPAVAIGTNMLGIQLPMYSICPISHERVILVVGYGTEGTSREVLGFRPSVLYKPQRDVESKSVTLRVKRLYAEEVQQINREVADAAQIGYVFQKENRGRKDLRI